MLKAKIQTDDKDLRHVPPHMPELVSRDMGLGKTAIVEPLWIFSGEGDEAGNQRRNILLRNPRGK